MLFVSLSFWNCFFELLFEKKKQIPNVYQETNLIYSLTFLILGRIIGLCFMIVMEYEISFKLGISSEDDICHLLVVFFFKFSIITPMTAKQNLRSKCINGSSQHIYISLK